MVSFWKTLYAREIIPPGGACELRGFLLKFLCPGLILAKEHAFLYATEQHAAPKWVLLLETAVSMAVFSSRVRRGCVGIFATKYARLRIQITGWFKIPRCIWFSLIVLFSLDAWNS